MNTQMKQKKAVLAAYLNMAQQNMVITLQHISKLMGVEVELKDGESLVGYFDRLKIWNDLKKNSKSENQDNDRPKSERAKKIIKLLFRHFPFLKACKESIYKDLDKDLEYEFEDVDRESIISGDVYRKVLRDVFYLLNTFRNEFTHYSPDPHFANHDNCHLDRQKLAVRYMYLCLDGGRRIVKERFKDSLAEKDFTFLTGTPRYEYTYKTVKGRRMVDKVKERKNFVYRLKEEDGSFSYVGLLLFICLFLHKRYIMMMLDQSGIFERGFISKGKQNFPECEKKIIRESFSVFRIRLPKERMESTRSDYALGLDMLNELQKCPKELYEVLSAEDKKIFRVERESNIDDEAKEESEVLLTRHDDRFPYFALRYIDECKVFDNIRFQVSLGKYRYAFYDKACIDTTEKDRLRSLQKEINGFGRLGEMEFMRTDKWGDYIDYSDEKRKPYITDQRAGYVFNGNRVGLLFNTKERHDMKKTNDMLAYMPELQFDTALKGKDAHSVPPIAWLSIYELPGLIFHQLLCKKYGVDRTLTEQIIKDTVALYHQLFTDIKNGELTPGCIAKEGNDVEKVIAGRYHTDHICLHQKDVPQKLLDYLTGTPKKNANMEKRFKYLARNRMEEELEKTKKRLTKFKETLKLIGTKENKFGKKKYEDIRPGSLARFLSKDLLHYQPYDDSKNNKVTGLNFQVLQSSLALYNGDFDKLKDILERANLLKEGMKHPFLQFVLNQRPKNILVFYEIYLTQKKAYLKGRLKDENESFKGLFRYEQRLKWRQRNTKYYKELAGRYMSELLEKGTTHYKPIELPTGLFEQPIKQLLKDNLTDDTDANAKMFETINESRCNVAYLIKCYFEWILVDNSQRFYLPTKERFKRTYKYFNIINNQKERNQLVQMFYTLDEIKEKLTKNNTGSRPIDDSIGEYLNSREAKALIRKDNDKEAPKRKLQKEYANYKKSELAIRRYKVQDMLVFLMAKELLIEKNLSKTGISSDTMDKIKSYKLQNIYPNGKEENILSLPIPLTLTLTLKDGTKRTIKQEAIKLKNYGDFFQFLYDDRIRTLLPYTKQMEIDREALEKELRTYDEERVNIFELVHQIEEIVFRKHPDELNNPKSVHYTFTDKYGNKIPIRNNFRAMMIRLGAKSDDIDEMSDVRNAFGHNHYATKMQLGDNDVPEIANAISKRFRKLVEKNKPRK